MFPREVAAPHAAVRTEGIEKPPADSHVLRVLLRPEGHFQAQVAHPRQRRYGCLDVGLIGTLVTAVVEAEGQFREFGQKPGRVRIEIGAAGVDVDHHLELAGLRAQSDGAGMVERPATRGMFEPQAAHAAAFHQPRQLVGGGWVV